MPHFAFIACLCVAFSALPGADEQVSVTLPDFGADLRAFDESDGKAVEWWPHVINAGWGDGRGGPERNGGWLDRNWMLVDYLDRSADYTTHEYLKHRGIWYEVYGSNEYQETIHFHEDGARKLLWDNGIARDMNGERVLSEHYNIKVDWWAERIGWNAYIVCNNAPRWWAIINYDWLTSPLLGFAISQDNIGGPTGWAVAGLIISPGRLAEDDSLMAHGLHTWHVSPRYANPNWYPITQVSCTPERDPGQLPKDDWTEVKAPPAGIPVVDLGANTESEVGDIVYAVAKIQASTAETVSLNFAASSQAQIWLNGEYIGYIPNEKGLRRDEFVAPLKLHEGENTLVVKLQRFWERHWMFCASLTR